MATLVLQAAGASLGGLFGPVGAMIGRAAGALAGNLIDRSLISGLTTIDGARLSTARIPGADEGTAINRVYGTMRVGGTLIWATRFEEDASAERSGSKATGARVETYNYYANFAVGLCEGPIAGIRRIWADGREIDQTEIEMRIYTGSETQPVDPLIEAKQSQDNAPAYRGLAYVVFERLPLDVYGNRIPVLQFEVMRVVDDLEKTVRAITIIPGATEHGYATVKVTEKTSENSARALNRNQLRRATDWEASLDELTALCPNLQRAALVVSWFGTDLRCGQCRILPGVETRAREDESTPWSVAGHDRATAHLVSQNSGGPAYGGTPNDQSVVQAIMDLKARGIGVYLYPFLMMDIAAGNDLADPYGVSAQPSYPWRGRITCHPAAGQAASADMSAAGREQVLAFAGSAVAGDFTVDGQSVGYGGDDHGYRRLVLHYALLAKAAGGVDGFIIGSELRGLTTVRDDAGAYPFVAALAALAADVRAILGPETKLTYGADWSEYFGHHPDNGGGDVRFHLDALWASDAIDAVGIDNYMPLADFRDDDFTAAQPDGASLADDEAAMRAAITSGEGFDWYYASSADRRARHRTPITDGLAAKPWTYRYKDIFAWWSNRHFDRIDGVEDAEPTAWIPGMKPIWFTELGCAAIDRGANQPNVFVDPKSSESETPYFSGGMRSDAMQRRFLSAHLGHWDSEAAPAGMVDPGHIFLWTWDARPYPAFPEDEDLFADGANWRTGHWLNGRLGAATLPGAIAAILDDCGFEDYDVSAVSGDLSGYVMGGQSSARDLIEPLVNAFRLDAVERDGVLAFRSRGLASLPATAISVLVDADDEARWSETVGQDGDYAGEAILTYLNQANDYESASARSRRLAVAHQRAMTVALPGVLSDDAAAQTAQAMLRDNRLSRRQISFSLSPADLAYETGDVVTLADGGSTRVMISRIEDGAARKVTAREIGAGDSLAAYGTTPRRQIAIAANRSYHPLVVLMDLPRLGAGETEDFAMVAVAAKPWRRTALSVSATTENFDTRVTLSRAARIGRLTAALGPGPLGVIDKANAACVEMLSGELASISRAALLNGANRLAVQCANGGWEIMAFQDAEETDSNVWRLSRLLRGLSGSEDAMAAGAVIGAQLVVLDAAVRPLGLKGVEAGLTLNWIAEAVGPMGGKSAVMDFTGGVRASTPLAPAHLKAKRLEDGDILFDWFRRGRLDSDGWAGDDIPLDEDHEAYRVDILLGDAVLRSLHVTETQALYTAAMQLADFGAAQSEITIRIRQKGARAALGIAATRRMRV